MESVIELDSSFCTLMDRSKDAIAIVDRKSGQFVTINHIFSSLFTYNLRELNTIGLASFYGISDSTRIKLQKAANFEISHCNVKAKDASPLTVNLSSSSIQLNGTDFLLLHHEPQAQDASKQLESDLPDSEQAYNEAEAKWQAITENSPDNIMMIDTNGIILFINHTVPNLTVDQVIGKSCYDFVMPEQVKLLRDSYSQAINSGKPVQFDFSYTAGDTTIHLYNYVWPIFRDKKVVALLVTSRDITDRLQTLKQLEKSQLHLHHALKAGKTGTWDWDKFTNEVTWSEDVEAIFGMLPGSFRGTYEAFMELIHPHDLPLIESAIEKTFSKSEPYYVEFRIIDSNGSTRWMCGQGEAYRDENGTPIGLIGTVQNITARKSAEAELLESQQKLYMHLHRTPLGVIDHNPNTEITEWNPAAERIFGYSREEVLGRSALGLIVTNSAKPRIEQAWKSLLSRQGGHKITNENITKDGRTIICEWYNTPLFDEKGNVIGVSSLVQDITDRVRVQEELEKHRLHLEELVKSRTEEIHEQALIIDQVNDSVVSTDFDGIIKSWNKGAEKMFGMTAAQAIGENISIVYPNEQHDLLFNTILPQLKKKGEFETEVEVQRNNGELFYVLLSLSQKHDLQGNPTGLIGYAIDITERKNSENKILLQHKALEAANKELETFSYSVSHDLRSPLRAIDGYTDLLLEDYYDLFNDEGKQHFQRIRKNAQRMAELIDDLLKLSRVGRQQLHKRPVNLSLMSMDIIQKHQDENPQHNVTVEVEDNICVKGDPSLLQITLDNLISNAWKYTEKTASPKIQFYRIKLNGTTTYCIKDNGVGFDMSYSNKLFGAFQRLHSPEEFSGNGIGLATVSRIINRHGGRVWAEGAVNKGATFFFTLGEH